MRSINAWFEISFLLCPLLLFLGEDEELLLDEFVDIIKILKIYYTSCGMFYKLGNQRLRDGQRQYHYNKKRLL